MMSARTGFIFVTLIIVVGSLVVLLQTSQYWRLDANEQAKLQNTGVSMESRLQAVEAYVNYQLSGAQHASHSADVGVQHDDGRSVSQASLGGRDCKESGVCSLGSLEASSWTVPPGKYMGAKCRGATLCNFGAGHPMYEGSPNQKDVGDNLFCPRVRADSVPVGALPEWVEKTGAASKGFVEIEQRLQLMDQCVEKWRQAHSPKERPCFRCHSVAGAPVHVKIQLELISLLPGGCRMVCETGFNRGDSILILTSGCSARAQGLSFTIDSRWYSRPGLGCLRDALSGSQQSITQVEGFTTSSIADFIARNSHLGLQCDVVHIDGAKTGKIRLQDLQDLRRMAHNGTLWITDDLETVVQEGQYRGDPQGKHCVFDVFQSFARKERLEMRCAGGKHGQCYAHRHLESMLVEPPTD